MALARVSLEDKYTSNPDASISRGSRRWCACRSCQRARDRAAGRNTAGFISGYRGSPLGTYDKRCGRNAQLEQHDIVFRPGVNEELAATAVLGQPAGRLVSGVAFDGVFGIWYGKGPGVDRSGDALQHANFAGTAPHGGVLAFAGDDHSCKVVHASAPERAGFRRCGKIPVLNPADIEDDLDFGLLGFALSRFSGLWVGVKAADTIAVSGVRSISIRIASDRHDARKRLPCASGRALTAPRSR